MDYIFEQIEAAFRDLIYPVIVNLRNMLLLELNSASSTISSNAAATPSSWNSSIFNIIESISDSVILPIAGIVITYVLCYDLITMITEHNNMHDIDSWSFFKWFFKAGVAIYLVSNTFTICNAFFDLAKYIVNNAGQLTRLTSSVQYYTTTVDAMSSELDAMTVGDLIGYAAQMLVAYVVFLVVSILIQIFVYGRMFQIYMYLSIAPIPFATLTNREWGQTGTNYIRALLAMAFQGFLYMVCLAIYSSLISGLVVSDTNGIMQVIIYSVLLVTALSKTGSVSMSIFNAH